MYNDIYICRLCKSCVCCQNNLSTHIVCYQSGMVSRIDFEGVLKQIGLLTALWVSQTLLLSQGKIYVQVGHFKDHPCSHNQSVCVKFVSLYFQVWMQVKNLRRA